MAINVDSVDPEKANGLSFAKQDHGLGEQRQQHHYAARTKERVRHFLHPDGRRIHVASSPEEVTKLQKQLSNVHKDGEFDIYLSGTPEHLEALRQAQTHHETRLTSFQEKHGEIYDQFASVHAELDALSSELERVTTHGVSLDAHFSKYGYDARIRTYDDESPASGTTTPRSNHSSEKSQSEAERGFATPLKLFKYPVVRQYFHKGILWRASGSEEVQSFELFVDLLYVGIIAIIGDAASEEATGTTLLHFIITFTLSWNIWTDMVLIISWFETDVSMPQPSVAIPQTDKYVKDIFQRLSIIFLLVCLFGFTININEAFEITYPTLVGFYLAARLYMACYLAICAILIPMMRNILIYHTCVALLGVALWIGSIHVEWPNQLALIWIALFVDLAGHSFYVVMMMISKPTKRLFERLFEIWPGKSPTLNNFVAVSNINLKQLTSNTARNA